MKSKGQVEEIHPGQVVYVIIRNPHAQEVANVQEAAVVQDLEDPNQLALFLYETYYLDAKHNGRTRFRFSINDNYIIKYFEPGRSRLHDRIEAAVKIAKAGLSTGIYYCFNLLA